LITGIDGGFGGEVDVFANLSRFMSLFSMFQILKLSFCLLAISHPAQYPSWQKVSWIGHHSPL
jgi:hypothetical protein